MIEIVVPKNVQKAGADAVEEFVNMRIEEEAPEDAVDTGFTQTW